MTLVHADYLTEILDGVRRIDDQLLHIFLTLNEDLLRHRIMNQTMHILTRIEMREIREWRLANVARCLAAREQLPWALLQIVGGDKLIIPFLLMELHMNPFKGRHFQRDIILWAVRWYCKYGISYRELQEMLAERGVNVDHSTIYRWVQRYAPEMEKRLRWYWRNPSDLCPWHMKPT